MKHSRIVSALLVMGIALSACEGGEVRETLGITRKAPDEFVVVSRPPLSVPPEFDLKPPQPGAISPHESTRNKARSALIGGSDATAGAGDTAVDSVSVSDAATSSDAVFFKKLKVDEADPEIRQVLGVDATKKPDTSNAKTLLDKLTTTNADQPTVDAKKEAERIRANKETGKPITEGETPTVDEKKNKSIIDRIF